jgi:type IV pilus modification protein PilV
MGRGLRRLGLARGFTLIEAFIALTLLAIGLLGLASLQIVAVRANTVATRMSHASELASDLAENVQRWDYSDARLQPLPTAVGSTDEVYVTSRADMGRSDPVDKQLDNVTAASKAEFGELPSDSGNATTNDALLLGTVKYGGTTVGASGGDYRRYWNVFHVDSPSIQGKLVQIIVRWPEAGLGGAGGAIGMRQIVCTTFKADPAAQGL